jgi:cyclophilin family peptidyl-prolyl cis-trans isomerase
MKNNNYLKDMEQARHAIAMAQTTQDPDTESDSDFFLLLGFGRDQDLGDEDDFTPVWSRRNRKKIISLAKSGRERESHHQNQVILLKGHNQNQVMPWGK